MQVFLPKGMPDPNTAAYRQALEELLFEVHVAMGGSTLTLFTNRREMEALHRELKEPLAAHGITLRCQFRGTSGKRLRDEFCANETLSLFALRSFWEGFDAPGDTLRCVIIPKLPFSRPTDPLQQERALRQRDAWKRYVLPEAVIDIKQAAGRLIRSSTDKGCLVLADGRLTSKWYGKSFLEALPSPQQYKLSLEEITERIRQSYGDGRS
jgi:ATP-dependent DNA helicase DinG